MDPLEVINIFPPETAVAVVITLGALAIDLYGKIPFFKTAVQTSLAIGAGIALHTNPSLLANLPDKINQSAEYATLAITLGASLSGLLVSAIIKTNSTSDEF
jgi:hypothetical protein